MFIIYLLFVIDLLYLFTFLFQYFRIEAEQKRQAELEKQRQQQLEMEREQEALRKKMIQQRLVSEDTRGYVGGKHLTIRLRAPDEVIVDEGEARVKYHLIEIESA